MITSGIHEAGLVSSQIMCSDLRKFGRVIVRDYL